LTVVVDTQILPVGQQDHADVRRRDSGDVGAREPRVGEAVWWEAVGNLPAESLPIAGCRQEAVDGFGAEVTPSAVLAAIENDLE